MIIEIDTMVLMEEKLTPTQLFILQLLAETQTTPLQQWYDARADNATVNQEIKQLIELEFLASLNDGESFDFSKLVALPKAITLSGMDRDWFQELVDKYPVKANRSDGTKDYLRTDLTRCRRIYLKMTNGNLSKHEKIMKCLEYELHVRSKEGNMAYMKRLPKWLASEEWKSFEERMADNEFQSEETNYGTELV